MFFNVTAVEEALKPLSEFAYSGVDVTPLLLAGHRDSRNTRADVLKSALCETEHTLRAVDGIFAVVSAIRDRLRSCSASVANALSPAMALPPEILIMIFKLLAVDGHPIKTPIVISHVCSRWRTLSLSLPDLWTIPEIPLRHKGMAEEFVRRSFPLPVRLAMRPPKWKPVEIDFRKEHAHRIQSLHLSSELSEDSLRSFSHCTPLLQLQEVSLDHDARYEHVHGALKTVRSLRMRGYPCVESTEILTMEHLTQLTIESVDPFVVYETLERISAPALARLVLSDVGLELEEWREASTLDSKSLSSAILHLSISDSNIIAWSAIMHWPFTQLKSFSIEVTETFTSDPMASQHFLRMFQTCKQLESFAISAPIPILVCSLVCLGPGSGHSPLPCLKTCRLDVTEWEVGHDETNCCELLLWIFRGRDAERMRRLERLEITQKIVQNHQDDLRTVVNNLILI